MADEEPTFRIPQRPIRRFPGRDGVKYEGKTVFTLRPAADRDDGLLINLIESVLDRTPYRYGDWFNLPMPLYLVHDDETGDTFRVAIRDGTVELHVLPETEPVGLRAFYRRLDDASDTAWTVTCRTE